MSPEQASGEKIDQRSDIFSTGILLYEMLTQRRMFTGDTMEILDKVRKRDFEPAERVVREPSPHALQYFGPSPGQRCESALPVLRGNAGCGRRMHV